MRMRGGIPVEAVCAAVLASPPAADDHRAPPGAISAPKPRPRRRLRSLQTACAATALVFATGGCVLLNPRHWGPDPLDHPAHPLTDDQAIGQVIALAKQIDDAAQMDGVDGGVSFASCNDQGDPPYQATLTMGFLIHGDPDVYFQTVAHAMAAHGWNQGAPPDQHYFGTALNKDGVVAHIGLIPSDHAYGQIHLYGQCCNMTDHHNDGKTNGTNITAQLPQH
jgi:hypothetical protein